MTVYSWGRGEDGQLGIGDSEDQHHPVVLESLSEIDIQYVACGSGHTVVLSNYGQVWTFGRGDDGRLGHGDTGWKYSPRRVDVLRGVVVQQVTCGSYHTCCVTNDGELYSWGGGMYGKLGHGDECGQPLPRKVEHLKHSKVVQVACGSRHTLALLESSQVFSWGDTACGVSGHGDVQNFQFVPTRIGEMQDKQAIQVAACGFHSAVLTDNGQVWMFGEGKFGRLGNGTEENQLVPQMVEILNGIRIKQVACGGFHSCAIADSGEAYTWGGGEHGQLGHGDKTNRLHPFRIRSFAGTAIAQATCGWSHTVLLDVKGQVYTFGNGDHGKLGHNDTVKVLSPHIVDEFVGKTVVCIASYNEHTVAITARDTLKKTPVNTSSYAKDMQAFVNCSDLSDVQFIIQGETIFAHRAILAARSKHFSAMFLSGMRESSESKIVISNTSSIVFLALMNYMYVDIVTEDPLVAVDLYVLADQYTMDFLKDHCRKCVATHISIENAGQLLQAVHDAHASELYDLCLSFCVKNFDMVSKSAGFHQLSRDIILELLQLR